MTNEMQQRLPVREGSSLPKAWVVTTVFNRSESVVKYLACLDRQSFRNFSLVLVDHGTQPLSLDIKFPEYVTLLRGSPEMWWTGAVNIGIRYLLESENVADQDVIILQNDAATPDASPGHRGNRSSLEVLCRSNRDGTCGLHSLRTRPTGRKTDS